MPDNGNANGGRRGLVAILCEAWRAFWSPTARISLGALVIVGAAGGVMFWGAFNWAMELTNTESFCISCHEMAQNVYREYKGTIHDANKSGVRATCPDCHVPKEWTYKVVRKIEATNELYHHFVAPSIDTREKFEAKRLQLATNVWTAMKTTDSRECRNCHDFDSMDVSMQRSRARTRHLQASDEGKTCIDCHKGVAHRLPAGAFTAERELNETWGSGRNRTQ